MIGYKFNYYFVSTYIFEWRMKKNERNPKSNFDRFQSRPINLPCGGRLLYCSFYIRVVSWSRHLSFKRLEELAIDFPSAKPLEPIEYVWKSELRRRLGACFVLQ